MNDWDGVLLERRKRRLRRGEEGRMEEE